MGRHLGLGLWVLFGLLLLLIANLALRACELGLAPLFGFQYCPTRTAFDAIHVEGQKEAQLRAAIHTEEMRIAALPRCVVCVPQRASPPNLAVIVDHSPSMNIPIDLGAAEAAEVRASETGPSRADDRNSREYRLMEEPHGRTSRFDSVRQELPGTLAKLGDRPLTIVTFRACTQISTRRATTQDLPGIVNSWQRPNRPSGKVGGTPIGASLQEAAQSFTPGPDGRYSGTILLVTDGFESCNADYCAIAREIARTKPGIKINVVDLTGYTEIGCVAAATGGQMYRRTADMSIGDLLSQAQEPIAPVCTPR